MKWVLAQVVATGAFLAIYFIVRFLLSLLPSCQKRESDELKAIKMMTQEIHTLIEKVEGGKRL